MDNVKIEDKIKCDICIHKEVCLYYEEMKNFVIERRFNLNDLPPNVNINIQIDCKNCTEKDGKI